ncbi:cupin domain-containing protein [Tuwongella immobilis]|uniref:AraC-type arabinose-binding/dimerisation domain-containing protein n=1 Tax=Tuwongella immobilis TaxID=692036 RepID=A0A6C2YSL7_9BACT|nr:AraC family ligand binding domain-containing protein [Tuwongella immobilis]VIP04371.1 Uncharacterized protein OS=Nitrospina gracilis (strain 3/211) GN=NITGR_10033 PE=4 SV=1: Cupin_2 [Tuwongella immobilis]VTS06104.1 Uncharacterized protein OS=Nitrospina gracilis (strain 3/211) GN=NITGR_10033 PE=4 SV=1: Cupin_2 [Tuwongella immobilis]
MRMIPTPTRINAPGTPPKTIEEFIGLVNSGHRDISIARMVSPHGWSEPGQTPEFDEFTLVLKGTLTVETRTGTHKITAGQCLIAEKGEWVRYSTPDEGGAEYVAICVPAFTPATVHRDE